MLNRRQFLVAGAAAAAIGLPGGVQASGFFPNGRVNSRAGTFDWTEGGGDPLQQHLRADGFRQALALPQLRLSSDTQQGLRSRLLRPASGQVDIAVLYEGRVMGDVMVSGNGWIALRPRPYPSRWTRKKTTADWWTWTNPTTRERWEIIVPHICSNLVLTRLGQAMPCICIPGKDACA